MAILSATYKDNKPHWSHPQVVDGLSKVKNPTKLAGKSLIYLLALATYPLLTNQSPCLKLSVSYPPSTHQVTT